MNGMILQAPTESKDIKLSTKKGEDTKSEKGENLFENLIAQLIEEEGESKNSNFILGKLLNLSSDFSDKGKIISEFSKGDLTSEEEEGALVLLEDLFKAALALKNGESFSTKSPTLKVALEDKSVITQFKEATNIKELLKIADKNGIKVKNFEFLNPKVTLNPNDKKIVQKVTSEEIFKMVDKKLSLKDTPLTQSVLTKIINQEQQKEKTVTREQQTTLSSLLSKDTKVKEEVKVAKVMTTTAGEIKKIVTNEKTASTKIEVINNIKKEIKHEKPTLEAEVETFTKIKPEKAQKNTLASLLKNETTPKELKPLQTQTINKEETSLKSDSEVKEAPIEKSTQMGEIKSELVHKLKETPDVKKTFNTFAMEFKEKVEAYKPPLMKINMQLSPGNLGDVDVTLVSRGNNLQVNISSNTNTLALFVQNQAEFKNSLVNMGFSDLQMNFGDNRGEERNQHQHKQQQDDYHDSEYDEQNDGIEMIIPNYV